MHFHCGVFLREALRNGGKYFKQLWIPIKVKVQVQKLQIPKTELLVPKYTHLSLTTNSITVIFTCLSHNNCRDTHSSRAIGEQDIKCFLCQKSSLTLIFILLINIARIKPQFPEQSTTAHSSVAFHWSSHTFPHKNHVCNTKLLLFINVILVAIREDIAKPMWDLNTTQ